MVAKQTTFFVFITILSFLLFLPFLSYGQNIPPAEFQPLVGIPGVTDQTGGGFGPYLNALYYLAISIAALIAVLKIIVAGAKYMLSGTNISSTQSAKSDIRGALIGLLIIIGAVVILNTINTDLTTMSALDDMSTLALDTEDRLGQALAAAAEMNRIIQECAERGTDECVTINTSAFGGAGLTREECVALGGTHQYNAWYTWRGICSIPNPGSITNNQEVCRATQQNWNGSTCTGCMNGQILQADGSCRANTMTITNEDGDTVTIDNNEILDVDTYRERVSNLTNNQGFRLVSTGNMNSSINEISQHVNNEVRFGRLTQQQADRMVCVTGQRSSLVMTSCFIPTQ